MTQVLMQHPVFIPPQWVPSQRGGRIIIVGAHCYHITKTKVLPGIIDDEDEEIPLGIKEHNLQCTDRDNQCRCTAKIQWDEEADIYSAFSYRPGQSHHEDCTWDLAAICYDFYKGQVYKKLLHREFKCVEDSRNWAFEQFRKYYPTVAGYAHFPTTTYFKTKGNKLIRAFHPPLPENVAALENIVIPPHMRITLHHIEEERLFHLFSHSFDHPSDGTFPHGRRETMIVFGSAARFIQRSPLSDPT